MEAFLVSCGLVALAEMGDKTQLLSLMLAARFGRPKPIVFGILIATLANHALAGAVGAWVADTVGMDRMRWILGISFFAMSLWALIPDKMEKVETQNGRWGVFGTTLLLFFLAEMGDKTQVATVALAARFQSVYVIVAGTTIGMMIANVPVVYFGEKISRKIPLKVLRFITAGFFGILGILTLVNFGNIF